MKTIQLTQGKVALVDDEDYERVVAFGGWHAACRSGANSEIWYAARKNATQGSVYLHRFVLGVLSGVVDHINGNGLDCRRENMRACSQRDNVRHQKKTRGASRFKGVGFDKRRGKWTARIGSRHFAPCWIGYFASDEEAARAYDAEARKRHGEFAILNFPEVA